MNKSKGEADVVQIFDMSGTKEITRPSSLVVWWDKELLKLERSLD